MTRRLVCSACSCPQSDISRQAFPLADAPQLVVLVRAVRCGAPPTVSVVALAFAQLLAQQRRDPLPVWWVREVAQLREMPIEMLRLLWDLYDGCNAPLGFAGETIHAVLNELGDGAYCAV